MGAMKKLFLAPILFISLQAVSEEANDKAPQEKKDSALTNLYGDPDYNRDGSINFNMRLTGFRKPVIYTKNMLDQKLSLDMKYYEQLCHQIKRKSEHTPNVEVYGADETMKHIYPSTLSSFCEIFKAEPKETLEQKLKLVRHFADVTCADIGSQMNQINMINSPQQLEKQKNIIENCKVVYHQLTEEDVAIISNAKPLPQTHHGLGWGYRLYQTKTPHHLNQWQNPFWNQQLNQKEMNRIPGGEGVEVNTPNSTKSNN